MTSYVSCEFCGTPFGDLYPAYRTPGGVSHDGCYDLNMGCVYAFFTGLYEDAYWSVRAYYEDSGD